MCRSCWTCYLDDSRNNYTCAVYDVHSKQWVFLMKCVVLVPILIYGKQQYRLIVYIDYNCYGKIHCISKLTFIIASWALVFKYNRMRILLWVKLETSLSLILKYLSLLAAWDYVFSFHHPRPQSQLKFTTNIHFYYTWIKLQQQTRIIRTAHDLYTFKPGIYGVHDVIYNTLISLCSPTEPYNKSLVIIRNYKFYAV